MQVVIKYVNPVARVLLLLIERKLAFIVVEYFKEILYLWRSCNVIYKGGAVLLPPVSTVRFRVGQRDQMPQSPCNNIF